MAIIPEKIANFQVYAGARSELFLGVADAELPSFDAITEKISGAGIAGEMDSPVPGHFGSQSMKLKFRTATPQVLLMPSGIYHIIDLRAAEQTQDPALGALGIRALRIEVRGPLKSLKPGKVEPGKPMDAEIEVECSVIRVSVNGALVIELDKMNSIYKVNGVDYLAAVRAATGG